ncbi:hypothetical protein LR48_Vigan07g112700 [Vigna angularis]|uniref:Uncharacterized protein n=1 Tax=Phaseolus angularis TaxID=3914 RepID=A0A0L9UXD4_PHAAN|nr:hypothetical protein LR48_Vigan07g112700 [Vigna angularis]
MEERHRTSEEEESFATERVMLFPRGKLYKQQQQTIWYDALFHLVCKTIQQVKSRG